MSQYDDHMKMIGDIINEFDYDRVHAVMSAINWTWHSIGVPSVHQLKVSSRERMESAIKGCIKDGEIDIPYFTSSGGLKAVVMKNERNKVYWIQLEFVLAEWDTSLENL